MTGYAYRGSDTGRRLQELQEQKVRDIEHIRVIDEQNREILARRKQHRRAKATEANDSPIADVLAEAELIRREAVANMTIGYYEEGTARLQAATEEVDQRRMARYNRTAQRNRTNQGRESA